MSEQKLVLVDRLAIYHSIKVPVELQDVMNQPDFIKGITLNNAIFKVYAIEPTWVYINKYVAEPPFTGGGILIEHGVELWRKATHVRNLHKDRVFTASQSRYLFNRHPRLEFYTKREKSHYTLYQSTGVTCYYSSRFL